MILCIRFNRALRKDYRVIGGGGVGVDECAHSIGRCFCQV